MLWPSNDDVQMFTASGTWNKPPGRNTTRINAILLNR